MVRAAPRMLTVIETRAYLARAEKLLSEAERETIKAELAAQPERGVLMQGTGGVRKARFGAGGRGQSGGVRVVYYFHNETLPVFLLTIFAKNERANLSREERNRLAATVGMLRETYGTGS